MGNLADKEELIVICLGAASEWWYKRQVFAGDSIKNHLEISSIFFLW